MQPIFTRIQTLDATPDQSLVTAYNHHVARNNPKYQLIVNDQVRPCFFSGDIEQPGKVVTISLNPAYTPKITEAEQAGMSFREWYDFCRLRFARYPSGLSPDQFTQPRLVLLLLRTVPVVGA